MSAMGGGGGELNFVVGNAMNGMGAQTNGGPLQKPPFEGARQFSNAMEGALNKTAQQMCGKINESFHCTSGVGESGLARDANISAIETKIKTVEKSASGQYGMMMH